MEGFNTPMESWTGSAGRTGDAELQTTSCLFACGSLELMRKTTMSLSVVGEMWCVYMFHGCTCHVSDVLLAKLPTTLASWN